jgi:hypothetical protein
LDASVSLFLSSGCGLAELLAIRRFQARGGGQHRFLSSALQRLLAVDHLMKSPSGGSCGDDGHHRHYTSNLTMSVTHFSGLFTGKFTHPITGAATTFGGVVLQRQNLAGVSSPAPLKAAKLS